MSDPQPLASVPSLSRSIVTGGLAGFGLSLLFVWIPGVGPVLCCGALVSTGLLAVWHRVAMTRVSVPGGEAVRMGAQAGLVAFVSSTAVLALSWLAAGRPNMASLMRESAQAFDANGEQDLLAAGARGLDQPAVVLGVVLSLVLLYLLLGTLGGALGAGVFKRIDSPPRTEA